MLSLHWILRSSSIYFYLFSPFSLISFSECWRENFYKIHSWDIFTPITEEGSLMVGNHPVHWSVKFGNTPQDLNPTRLLDYGPVCSLIASNDHWSVTFRHHPSFESFLASATHFSWFPFRNEVSLFFLFFFSFLSDQFFSVSIFDVFISSYCLCLFFYLLGSLLFLLSLLNIPFFFSLFLCYLKVSFVSVFNHD